MKKHLPHYKLIYALDTIDRMLPTETFLCEMEMQALGLISKKKSLGVRYLTVMAASLLILISFNLSFLEQNKFKNQTVINELKNMTTNDIYLLPAKSIYHE